MFQYNIGKQATIFMILAMFDIKLDHHNNIPTGVVCYCHNFYLKIRETITELHIICSI